MSKLINSRSNWLSINKIYPYAVVGILVLAFSIRLIGLDKGIWLDEAFTIRMISQENLSSMLEALTPLFSNGPVLAVESNCPTSDAWAVPSHT